MTKKNKTKDVRICEDCQKAILASGSMGILNLHILKKADNLKIVPKNQCQRCKALKGRK